MLEGALGLKIIDSDELTNILTKRIPVGTDNKSIDQAIIGIMKIISETIG